MNTTPADYVVVFVDVLGFSDIVLAADWPRITDFYTTLHSLVSDFWGAKPPPDADETGSLLFSDCALMWTPYSPERADSLLALAAEFFCECLRAGVALRGAVAAGELLVDPALGVVVGPPLIQAWRAEQGQQWCGIALCPSLVERADHNIRARLHARLGLLHV